MTQLLSRMLAGTAVALDESSGTVRMTTALDPSAALLAATGADEQLVLVIGIIAGALLIGGIVVTAVGASRRRAKRE
ncbi:MAG: hypothetical protein RJQ01_06110 [Microcella sp.]|uniref:hypothetical protein n=1 Tax=Microcella sp. TaxID=1913979 RepID=UPI003314A1B4